MRVVIAPDSFKECTPAAAVAKALAEGWRRVFPEDDLRLVPMADGGEGTVDALVAATGGQYVRVPVTGPLGEPVEAVYGLLGDAKTAVIEMASASGLPRVPLERRDPRTATTYGTGELIRHALENGARRIIIGIGGSATNDGGAGMAQALGYGFYDDQGRPLPPGGAALARLARIDASSPHPGLAACDIQVACDVDNPLCGPRGASRVYGPQKGATPEMVEELDAALRHFGAVIGRELGVSVMDLPGAGAAGGLGAGLMAFAGGRLRPGVELVADACGLAEHMRGAGLVITGEGRLDGQSAHGKTPVGVARLAKAQGVPVVAVAGALGEAYGVVYEQGIDAAWSISPGPMTLDEAMEKALPLLTRTAEAVARTWRAARTQGAAG
jgi:glycerate kinase